MGSLVNTSVITLAAIPDGVKAVIVVAVAVFVVGWSTGAFAWAIASDGTWTSRGVFPTALAMSTNTSFQGMLSSLVM